MVDLNKQYEVVMRSVNAWTTKDPVYSGNERLFVKAAPAYGVNTDDIMVDAMNSACVQDLAATRPALAGWTMVLKNVYRCSIIPKNKNVSVLSFKGTGYYALVYVAIQVAKSKYNPPVIADFLQNLITESRMSGLTHNDLHTGNVLFDGKKLVLIDYGRMVFGISPPSPRSTLANDIMAVGGNVPRPSYSSAAHWYFPFKERWLQPLHAVLWVPDVIMFSTHTYTDLLYSDPSLAVPFLKRKKVDGDIRYFADFKDDADLLAKIKAVHPALRVLLPGLVMLAILVRLVEGRPQENYLAFNFSMRSEGGRVLYEFFTGGLLQRYIDVIAFALDSAGLDAGFMSETTQAGGADDKDFESDEKEYESDEKDFESDEKDVESDDKDFESDEKEYESDEKDVESDETDFESDEYDDSAEYEANESRDTSIVLSNADGIVIDRTTDRGAEDASELVAYTDNNVLSTNVWNIDMPFPTSLEDAMDEKYRAMSAKKEDYQRVVDEPIMRPEEFAAYVDSLPDV